MDAGGQDPVILDRDDTALALTTSGSADREPPKPWLIALAGFAVVAVVVGLVTRSSTDDTTDSADELRTFELTKVLTPAPVVGDRPMPVRRIELDLPPGNDLLRVIDDEVWALDGDELLRTRDGRSWSSLELPGSGDDLGDGGRWLDVDAADGGEVIVAVHARIERDPDDYGFDDSGGLLPRTPGGCVYDDEPYVVTLWRSLDAGESWSSTELSRRPGVLHEDVYGRHVVLVDDNRRRGSVVVATYPESPWPVEACIARRLGVDLGSLSIRGDDLWSDNTNLGRAADLVNDSERRAVELAASSTLGETVLHRLRRDQSPSDVTPIEVPPGSLRPLTLGQLGTRALVVDEPQRIDVIDGEGLQTVYQLSGDGGFADLELADDELHDREGRLFDLVDGWRSVPMPEGVSVRSYAEWGRWSVVSGAAEPGGGPGLWWSDGTDWFLDANWTEDDLSGARLATVGGRLLVMSTGVGPSVLLEPSAAAATAAAAAVDADPFTIAWEPIRDFDDGVMRLIDGEIYHLSYAFLNRLAGQAIFDGTPLPVPRSPETDDGWLDVDVLGDTIALLRFDMEGELGTFEGRDVCVDESRDRVLTLMLSRDGGSTWDRIEVGRRPGASAERVVAQQVAIEDDANGEPRIFVADIAPSTAELRTCIAGLFGFDIGDPYVATMIDDELWIASESLGPADRLLTEAEQAVLKAPIDGGDTVVRLVDDDEVLDAYRSPVPPLTVGRIAVTFAEQLPSGPYVGLPLLFGGSSEPLTSAGVLRRDVVIVDGAARLDLTDSSSLERIDLPSGRLLADHVRWMDRDVVLARGDTPEIWSRAADGEWKLHGTVADLVDEERGRTYRWTTLDVYRDDLFLGDDFGATWRGTSTG